MAFLNSDHIYITGVPTDFELLMLDIERDLEIIKRQKDMGMIPSKKFMKNHEYLLKKYKKALKKKEKKNERKKMVL